MKKRFLIKKRKEKIIYILVSFFISIFATQIEMYLYFCKKSIFNLISKMLS